MPKPEGILNYIATDSRPRFHTILEGDCGAALFAVLAAFGWRPSFWLSKQDCRVGLYNLQSQLSLCSSPLYGSFRKLAVPYSGVLIIRILLFRALYWGPLVSETPISQNPISLKLRSHEPIEPHPQTQIPRRQLLMCFSSAWSAVLSSTAFPRSPVASVSRLWPL